MPVLIDTSAWIEFYRVKGDAEIKRLVTEILGREEVVTVAPVVAELLRGAKAAGDRAMIERTLLSSACCRLVGIRPPWLPRFLKRSSGRDADLR